jgi:HlyD family secretion protein
VELKVSEGDTVKLGETELATHVGQTTLALQSELAQSQIEDAKRELAQKILAAESSRLASENALSAANMQLTQARQGIELATSEKRLNAAREKLERLRKLAADTETQLFVSTTDIEEQTLLIEQSEWDLSNARRQQEAAIKSAMLNVELAEKSLIQANSVLDSLNELKKENHTLNLAKRIADEQVRNARLIAPSDGTILKIFASPGEVVVNSPLMQMGNLSEMICVVEVVDRLASMVQLQQRVSIVCPALTDPIQGTVAEVGRMVGHGSLAIPNPLAMTERNTIEVEIKIDDEDAEVARKLINLQVTAEIFTSSSGLDDQNVKAGDAEVSGSH